MLILEEIHSCSLWLGQRLMILDKTAEQGPPFQDGLYQKLKMKC